MHPAIIIGTVRSLIVDVAMGQIPRSTERISSVRNIITITSVPALCAKQVLLIATSVRVSVCVSVCLSVCAKPGKTTDQKLV